MAFMDGEIDFALGAMHLTEEEASPVVIAAPTTDGSDKMRTNCLLGKLLIDRKHDVRCMRAAFHQSWGCEFELIQIQGKLFQIIFEFQHDVDRVLRNGPWCFSGSLFCLQRWVEDWEIRTDLFSSIDFWVHVVNLPYHVYTEHIGGEVAKALITSGGWQLRTEQPSGRRLFRMRVSVDLRKPIRRFVRVIINGAPLIGKLEYERLPHLCGHCGGWNHTVSVCPDVGRELTEEERSRLPYGAKQKLNVVRRSTLLKDVQPGSMYLSHGLNDIDSGAYNLIPRTMGTTKIVQPINRLMTVEGDNIVRDRGNIVRTNERDNIFWANERDAKKLDTVSACPDLKGELTEEPYGEAQALNVSCRSTLVKGFCPGSTPVRSSVSAMVSTVNTIVPHTMSVRKSVVNNSASEMHNSTSVMNGIAAVQPLNHRTETDKGEEVVRERDNGGPQSPLTQLVVNLTSDVAPIFTSLMQQFISHPMGNFNGPESDWESIGNVSSRGANQGSEKCIQVNRSDPIFTNLVQQRPIISEQSMGNTYTVVVLPQRSLARRPHVFKGVRHTTIQMHIDDGDRPEMEKKRKAHDVVDGVSSRKKTRLSISEPLVEPVESQAHPAP